MNRVRKRELYAFISEHVIAGRWEEVRKPSEKEIKATSVLEFSIEEASAKVRQGPPLDDEEDYNLQVWAGILPLGVEAKTPIPDPRLPDGVEVPQYLLRSRKE